MHGFNNVSTRHGWVATAYVPNVVFMFGAISIKTSFGFSQTFRYLQSMCSSIYGALLATG